MKVHELIERLQELNNPELHVNVEGCDCIRRSEGLYLPGNGTVLITSRDFEEGEV